MVDSSTAAEAAETEATNEHKQTGRKPEKTRAQKDAHNASCRKSRLKRKMEFEELAAKNPKMKKKLDEMQVELQSMYTKLEERNSEITLLKTALQKLGTNFTSFKELEEWIISQKYEQVGQGSGPNDTNVTATAAAGPSFVATHDHSPNNAAGFSTPSDAGPFSAAYHFDFDNDYLFTDYDDLDCCFEKIPSSRRSSDGAYKLLTSSSRYAPLFYMKLYILSINEIVVVLEGQDPTIQNSGQAEMQNDNDDDDDFDFVNAKNRGGGKEILLKVGVHEHMVDSSTAAEAAETEATNEHKQTDRKPDKTRAQRDAHNAACRMSRLKRKMDVEKLEADYLQTKKKFHKMQVEHQSMYTVMRADLQSMYTKLEERNSEITLLKTALRILGINFTSVKELQEWILSLKYEKVGQGSGPNDTNVTASAAAGPSFVATHDHSPNNAAGNKAGILNASAAGRSFDANYALLPAFSGNSLRRIGHTRKACAPVHMKARTRSEMSKERLKEKESKLVAEYISVCAWR
ncbi:hypothetical protein QQP08_009859 [Theobroma cacao]|nr:hypothetical protein QQP08_009859 [Theobroma cacao]